MTGFSKYAYAKKMSEKLPILRTAMGVTQGEFAEILGITRQSYVAYEAGQRTVPWKQILSMQYVFEHCKETQELSTFYHLRLTSDDIFRN